MRQKAGIFVVMAMVLCAAFINFLSAQEGVPEYAYGTVVSASSRSITITEYDYDKEEEVEVGYAITPDTIFEHDAALSDITPGDMADIEYILRENSRVARSVMIEKAFVEMPPPGEMEGEAGEGAQPGEEGEQPGEEEDSVDADDEPMDPGIEKEQAAPGDRPPDHPFPHHGAMGPHTEEFEGEFEDVAD